MTRTQETTSLTDYDPLQCINLMELLTNCKIYGNQISIFFK